MKTTMILRRVAIIMGCAAIILVPAFINGYPLVFSDTGTYLRSGFEGDIPIDRPYWYGAFARLMTLEGKSLWGVAIAQALLCSIYLFRIAVLTVGPRGAVRVVIIASAILTVGTGLGWNAGQVSPDVLTGVGLLAMFLLLRGDGRPWMRFVDALVIAGACWTHLSNLLILPLAGLLLLFITRRSPTLPIRQSILWLGSATVLSWGGLYLANGMLVGKAHISRSSHVFLMGRMLDTGMLRPYLEEHCPTEHWGICAYKDSLPPHSEGFLWWGHSPVAKQGGWEATRDEYTRIVHGSFTEPRFFWWHVRGSLSSTAEQLCAWELSKGLVSEWYRTPDSPPHLAIASYLPHELDEYRDALQNGGRGELDMHWPDRLYRLVLASSLLAMAWYILRRRAEHDATAQALMLYALGGVIIGAWVCATLSMADARYLGRDSWLLPLAVILAFAQHRMPNRAATTAHTLG